MINHDFCSKYLTGPSDSWFAVSRREIRRGDNIRISLSLWLSPAFCGKMSQIFKGRLARLNSAGGGGLAVSVSVWGLSIRNITVLLHTAFHCSPELQNSRWKSCRKDCSYCLFCALLVLCSYFSIFTRGLQV